MPDLLQEVRLDVKEIKGQVVELVKQGAINTVVLQEHERRSTNLESRLKPIERIYFFCTIGGSLSLFVLALVKVLYR